MPDLVDWERRLPRVTYALIHGQGGPGRVLIAQDEESIGQALAVQVIAPETPEKVGTHLGEIRSALLERRWADAVVSWMSATGSVVDCYPDEPVWSSVAEGTAIDLEFEFQFMPIFRDPGA